MKKNQINANIIRFMVERNKLVFVNDFSGNFTAPCGFKLGNSMEGNKLIAENGAEYEPQYESLRIGNNIGYQLRDSKADTVENHIFDDMPLFENYTVVIKTGSECLRAFAPVFSDKKDVILFLAYIEELFEPFAEDSCANRIKDEIVELTVWLFKNNPNKTEAKSVFDLV